MKVLMVCLGNICRSPMADGLLRKKVAESGLNVVVDSAGTAGYHVGEAPDPRMQETAKRMGTPIEYLRARQFNQIDYDYFDLIYVMDTSNYQNVINLARNDSDRQKVKLILEELYPESKMEVPDPYFGGEQGFVDVYKMLDSATDTIIKKIKQHGQRNRIYAS